MALRNRILSVVGLVVTFVTFPPALAAFAVSLDGRLICGNHVTDPLTVWGFAMLGIYAAWQRKPHSP